MRRARREAAGATRKAANRHDKTPVHLAVERGHTAVVRLFDVRAAVEEQAKSMGAEFLKVDFEESGEGAGGYAKEMSAEWHAASNRMLLAQMADVDIVITTALIPGKPAPKLVDAAMVAALKPVA